MADPGHDGYTPRPEPTDPADSPFPWRERVLSDDDLAFFDDNGYVIVHNAITDAAADATVNEMWNFLGMDRDDPSDWYRDPLHPVGFVEMFHAQVLWDNRTNPRVYNAFADLWGTDELWCSIDRCGLKPPWHETDKRWQHKGFLHWDMDVWAADDEPLPFQLQGAIALTDTDEDMGGFHCVPGFYRTVGEWTKKHPVKFGYRKRFYNKLYPLNVPGREKRKLKDTPVAMEKGDLVIWRGETPHGNGANTSDRPRFACYVTMFPARPLNGDILQNRIDIWANRLPPKPVRYPQFPDDLPSIDGDPRRLEEERGTTAELTPLGQRLLGSASWLAPLDADEEQSWLAEASN